MALLDSGVGGLASGRKRGSAVFYDEVQATVNRAAELLPEPPLPGYAEGYARWEALTVDVGRRLARVLEGDTGLLGALIDDESLAPVACRGRRGLLLRVALLAARQMAGRPATERPGLSRPSLSERPIWLDAITTK
jgi:hypothetical protein